MLTNSSSGRLPGLDGCRALAIGLVIAFHAGLPVPADLGVQFFFVLSGFLITRLLYQEFDSTGQISLRAFYARRALRIFPAYLCFLVLSFTLDRIMGDRWSTAMLASAFTYTVNYFNAMHNHPGTSIAHAWSLAVEEQFYLLWPLALIALLSRRRSVVGALIGAGVLACVWRSIAFLYFDSGTAYVYNAFETRFDSLAVGCCLAVLSRTPQVESRLAGMSRSWWYPLPVLALVYASRVAPSPYHYSLGFTVDAVLMAVFLVQAVQLSSTSAAWRWLEARPTRFLGTISYPLYLYHQWGNAVGRHLGGPVVSLVATLVLAVGSYVVIERPFLRLKGRWERRPAAIHPAAALAS